MSLIYLIGSLRNPEIPKIGDFFREAGFDVFDEWHSAGERADDAFHEYAKGRGWSYDRALKSYAAQHIFDFDKRHLDRADMAILAMPAGKSGHLELGYIIGQGKRGYILMDKEPERIEQMHQFANGIYFSKEQLLKDLK